ncbi:type II toxin-antitoxin system RelE/ParE family toxin [Photobacterium damselae]|uniref:type II toxin-antitoxin system RelE/ParE family toxin n=1 Tax=Photobacterium damselae TaxID=38293 RepID=UPI0040680A4B
MAKLKIDVGNSEKDLAKLPRSVLERFVMDLDLMCDGESPLSKSKPLNGLGKGVFELVKNGRPAYRCVYTIKNNVIHILHVFSKTSDGTDKKHEETIKLRFKAL